jgi:hypothetical protein
MKTHDGAAVKAGDQETEQEPSLESNLSDWTIQHNRSGPFGAKFYPVSCGVKARCFNDLRPYLGMQEARRNEAAARSLGEPPS